MPWNSAYYPRSMSHLPEVVRAKAIEIANALLDEGYEEGRAIRIAIAKAKESKLPIVENSSASKPEHVIEAQHSDESTGCIDDRALRGIDLSHAAPSTHIPPNPSRLAGDVPRSRCARRPRVTRTLRSGTPLLGMFC